MLWILSLTLAAAMARQVSTDFVPGVEEAWEKFRVSLQGLELSHEMMVRFDLMEGRGEPPPGWIVHPKFGLFHLFNAVVHVVDDDTPRETLEWLLNPPLSEGWTPVQLFVHRNPSQEMHPRDYGVYYALELFRERGARQAETYQEALDEPWADVVSIRESTFERDMDDLDRIQHDVFDRRCYVAAGWVDEPLLFEAYVWGLEGREGTTEDLFNSLGFDARRENEDGEGWLAWFPGGSDEYPSDNVGFDQILELLREHGIQLLNNEFIWADYDVELMALTRMNETAEASIRALKHGFVLAQIQDGYNIKYYRNYLVYPTPPEDSPFVHAYMRDAEADARARQFMTMLPKREVE